MPLIEYFVTIVLTRLVLLYGSATYRVLIIGLGVFLSYSKVLLILIGAIILSESAFIYPSLKFNKLH